MNWQPIETAPWQTVILVRNSMMEKPVRATRGYYVEGRGVHPDDTFFTTVYTPDRFFPTPGGNLVCPEQWTPLPVDDEQTPPSAAQAVRT